jgi:hypothetical protein
MAKQSDKLKEYRRSEHYRALRRRYMREYNANHKGRINSATRERWADKWERNPERAAEDAAKRCIAATTGLSRRDMPDELVEAKAAYLMTLRQLDQMK